AATVPPRATMNARASSSSRARSNRPPTRRRRTASRKRRNSARPSAKESSAPRARIRRCTTRARFLRTRTIRATSSGACAKEKTRRTAGFFLKGPQCLLELGFPVQDVLPRLGIVHLDLQLVGRRPLVLGGRIEMTGTGGRLELDLFAHGS